MMQAVSRTSTHRPLAIFGWLIAFLILLVAPARADFAIGDFTGTDQFHLHGHAAIVGGRLRLTPALEVQGGRAWYKTKQPVAGGFETTFRFQLTQQDARGGADGFAFVIQNQAEWAGSWGGHTLAYDGIANSVAIEFDTWKNDWGTPEEQDPDGNHVSVHTNGTGPNDYRETFSIGRTSPIPNLKDGNIHWVRILYAQGSLTIYVDDFTTPALQVPLDLSTRLALDNGKAWVGFTAGTGIAYQNHDIVSWAFYPNGDRPPLTIGAFDRTRIGDLNLVDGRDSGVFRQRLLQALPGASMVGISTLTSESLRGLDLVVLGVSTASYGPSGVTTISPEEQQALWEFVRGGGGAVLFTDNDSHAGDNTDPANESLLEPFGLDVTGTLQGPQPALVAVPLASPVTHGAFGFVSSFTLNWSGWFDSVGSSAVPRAVLGSNGQPCLAETPRGVLGPVSGAVVYFSDDAALYDFAAEETRALLFNALDYTARASRVHFALAHSSVDERAGTATVEITRSGSAREPLIVEYATLSGSATDPSMSVDSLADFGPVQGSLALDSGVTSARFSVPITADHSLEGDESLELLLTSYSRGQEPVTERARLTITDDLAIPAPSELAASRVDTGGVQLTWTDNCDNETGFRIERSSDDGATWPVTLDAPGSEGFANTVTFTDTTAVHSGAYQYRVRAAHGDVRSNASNTVAVSRNLVETTIIVSDYHRGSIGDTIKLSAHLRRSDDAYAAIGERVTFRVDGDETEYTGITDVEGLALVDYTIPAGTGPGDRTIHVSFAGRGELAPSNGENKLTVKVRAVVTVQPFEPVTVGDYTGTSIRVTAHSADGLGLHDKRVELHLPWRAAPVTTKTWRGDANFLARVDETVAAGSYTVEVRVPEDDNYSAASATATLLVNKGLTDLENQTSVLRTTVSLRARLFYAFTPGIAQWALSGKPVLLRLCYSNGRGDERWKSSRKLSDSAGWVGEDFPTTIRVGTGLSTDFYRATKMEAVFEEDQSLLGSSVAGPLPRPLQ
jgi:hypothetical protein